ncbi:MOSC domain-containing protein [Tumebacillus permanentifrigoris]|uniref:MOSC domain-containing protein YiiM n=1 Tax=Tumebacillus permanentifrigoris TaxID=378543 RepID=A0A316DAZ3_9BACL|nr:MOSC domain-containing protein [Tumebacillus permanentifrigoris]PWK14898.1 MOSC domain-containing protein YiiM [Tumebacillus permanentifrigoris]
MKPIEIVALYVGKPVTLRVQELEVATGIGKQLVADSVWLSFERLAGDDVANTKYHGGEARTVCVYPQEHYAHWEQEFGVELTPGAFGENLTVRGLTEEDVCIGDTFQLGEAVVQVTQARIPCGTIDLYNQLPGLFRQTAVQAKSGYFFRTVQEGAIARDSELRLLERDPHGVTVRFCLQTWYHDQDNREAIQRILAVPALADNWRGMLQRQLDALQ